MLTGTIVRGKGFGKTLGYPTANIDCELNETHLGGGVYAATAILSNETYIAALVIMEKPCKVEVHLIGYTGPDVYGEELTVTPVQRVSTLETYDSIDELKKKIEKDIVLVRQVFDDPE